MMTRVLRTAVLAVLGVAAAVAPVSAAGFGIFEQGTRAMGMAGAFTAQADDPSALWHNAGGLAFFDETDFAAGFTYIMSSEADFQGADPFPGTSASAEQEPLSEFIPHAYWMQPINDQWKFGLGVYAPFGLTTEWKDPETFPGRYISTLASLRAIDLNPTIGWKVTDRFGLGFGVVARFSDVELNRFVPFQNPFTGGILDAGTVELTSDFEPGYGFNLGLLHRYNESFSWGLSYRSKIKVEYGGTARFTQISTGIPPLDAAIARVIPFNQDLGVDTEIEFPDMASLGFMVALSANTRLEADINWTGWSSFDELPIVFTDVPPLSSTIPENWDDAMNYRLGLRWMSAGGSEWRFGYVFDETPQPDEAVSPLLPDADRNGFTIGWGTQFTKTSLDVAAMYLPFDERSTSTNTNGFNGTYNTTAWLFGITLGF